MQQRTRSKNQNRTPDWPAWAKAWGGLVVIAFVNGVLHRSYERRLGELRSHQVSSLLLLGLLAPWVIRTEYRHPLPTLPAALQVGLMWSSASVAFEFLFGHYINKDSWSELLHAYDVLNGRLWLLDVLGIAAAPAAARAWRIRDTPIHVPLASRFRR
jgi:hypothetical protein